MTETHTQITIPLPPDTAAVLGVLILIILASYVVFRALPSDAAKPKPLLQRFEDSWGLRIKDPLTGAFFVGVLFAYAMIFVFALLISLRLLAQLVFGLDLDLPTGIPNPSETPKPSTLPFGLAALLAAILGAPFIIWRSQVAAKQAAIAEEALFNDKINAAASDLAARRQVTRILNEGEPTETILTEWKDDLVTRAAAIDRLEGLAEERPDIAPRIARMLSIYVQELSREHPAETPPEGATPDELWDWSRGLSEQKRPDMERAVQSLGRINPSDADEHAAFDPSNIDLHACNLQGLDLHGLTYQGAQLGQAQMQGTNLSGAQMQGADLGGAQMQGAVLMQAQMQGADLFGAQMQGAVISRAKMQRANLSGAQMQGAVISRAQMQGAVLSTVQMQGANLYGAEMQGADFIGAEMQGASLSRAKMQGANLGRAEMQGANLYGARMQGAKLYESEMLGADLRAAEMSEDTNLTDASLQGAAVRSVDDTTIAQLQPFWHDIFADGTVLPGDPARPGHWPPDELEDNPFGLDPTTPFANTWRDWVTARHPGVTIAPDWSR